MFRPSRFHDETFVFSVSGQYLLSTPTESFVAASMTDPSKLEFLSISHIWLNPLSTHISNEALGLG